MTFNSRSFNSRFLGFDNEIRHALERIPGIDTLRQAVPAYPKFNLFTSDSGDMALIEIAVAGFSRSDLKVTSDSKTITVSGKQSTRPMDEKLVNVHTGISAKDFNISWKLTNGLEVKDASLADGILTIHLQSNRTEDLVKQVEIK